jgi:hypothetical protein
MPALGESFHHLLAQRFISADDVGRIEVGKE